MKEALHLEDLATSARTEDAGSIDGMIGAFYEIVSGPAGRARDWKRDETLYVPGGLFASTGRKPEGKPYVLLMDHEAYRTRSTPILESGFFEKEIHRMTHRFGNIAHVFSTYEARKTEDGPVFLRGVNSIELVHDGRRWWIVAAIWDTEREGNPIPKELLPEDAQ